MTDALRQLDALLANATAVPPHFGANSRYNGLPTLEMTLPDGRVVAYVARRFIPRPECFTTIREHLVTQGDRLDLLANTYFLDPELGWKIADANVAMIPADLTDAIGSTVRIAIQSSSAT